MSLKTRLKRLEEIAGAKELEFAIYILGDTGIEKWVEGGSITLSIAEYEQELKREKRNKNIQIINIMPV